MKTKQWNRILRLGEVLSKEDEWFLIGNRVVDEDIFDDTYTHLF